MGAPVGAVAFVTESETEAAITAVGIVWLQVVEAGLALVTPHAAHVGLTTRQCMRYTCTCPFVVNALSANF